MKHPFCKAYPFFVALWATCVALSQFAHGASLEDEFRISEGVPRFWDPVTGETRALSQLHRQKKSTRIPLTIAPFQGYFIVFTRDDKSTPAANPGYARFPESSSILTLQGLWQIAYDPKPGGPKSTTFPQLQDWTTHEERGIKYYFGIATYRKSFDPPVFNPKQTGRLFFDLGTVHDIARVRLNGKDLGVVWCAPWQVEVTNAIREGENQLEIEVANRWSNRQLGDTESPDKDARALQWDNIMLGGKDYKSGRYTFSTGSALGQLLPSGLIGTCNTENYQVIEDRKTGSVENGMERASASCASWQCHLARAKHV